MTNVAQVKGAAICWGQITRANGTVERKRMLAYHHPNALRQGLVRLLMKLGVF